MKVRLPDHTSKYLQSNVLLFRLDHIACEKCAPKASSLGVKHFHYGTLMMMMMMETLLQALVTLLYQFFNIFP